MFKKLNSEEVPKTEPLLKTLACKPVKIPVNSMIYFEISCFFDGKELQDLQLVCKKFYDVYVPFVQ